MPETFGKRRRGRTGPRSSRPRDREAGLIEPGPPVATPEEIEEQMGIVPPALAD